MPMVTYDNMHLSIYFSKIQTRGAKTRSDHRETITDRQITIRFHTFNTYKGILKLSMRTQAYNGNINCGNRPWKQRVLDVGRVCLHNKIDNFARLSFN